MAWQRGHFWIAIAGAVLCVLRARFFRLDVLRFGTAMGQDEKKGIGTGRLSAVLRAASATPPSEDPPRRWHSRTGRRSARPHTLDISPDNRPGTTRSRGHATTTARGVP